MSAITAEPSTVARMLRSGGFKNAPLKQIAFLCGLKSSGNKDELIDRLAAVANAQHAEPAAKKRDPLVLSIDLGIRNLGYSLLAPVAAASTANAPRGAPDLRGPSQIRLHTWQRRELLGPELEREVGLAGDAAAERFSPASLAVVADRLARGDVLGLRPTHVLIERQRWRSGGGAGVQEWTLRVNSLEAMLHASLRTLRELGRWDGEVFSVAPDRVTVFWPLAAGDESTQKTRRGRKSTETVADESPKKVKAKLRSKRHKIDVLTSWLTRDESVVLPATQDAEDAVTRFRGMLIRRRRSKTAEDEPEPRKLDDLTDCLLQGITWLKWEENKKLLLGKKAHMYYKEPKILDELLAGSLLDNDT
ncbi:Ydc2-catalyt-domain-containing protein [Hypoxylon sp. FL1284]|nr:Ydc2-catalyt-domain-containing protein [Hypoxylon sp. FL1284]